MIRLKAAEIKIPLARSCYNAKISRRRSSRAELNFNRRLPENSHLSRRRERCGSAHRLGIYIYTQNRDLKFRSFRALQLLSPAILVRALYNGVEKKQQLLLIQYYLSSLHMLFFIFCKLHLIWAQKRIFQLFRENLYA